MFDTTTVADDFRSAIAAAGLPPPDDVVADGRIHRFSTNGKTRDESGWYLLHSDGVPAGSFGDWRTGLTTAWCSKSTTEMTEAEKHAHRDCIKAMQSARDADQAQRHQQAAMEAEADWTQATPVTEHDYLTRKGVKTYGLREDGVSLLVPMRDTSGKLCSLQRITPDGGKRFAPGGRVTGCYFAIGKPSKTTTPTIIVCEGFATGASLHEATGQAVAVGFNAGNLMAVAQALRAKYPAMRIIVAADDDAGTDGNPGLTKATEAARAVGGLLAVPDFGADRPDGATDFNDLHQLCGAEAVAACIKAAQPANSASPPTAGATFPPLKDGDGAARTHEVLLLNGGDLTPEPVRWLWRDWLALGKLHILAGAPGQGKTTIALATAATVTTGGRWPDGSRCEPGNALIWSGEDDPADTLLPRLLAMGADKHRVWFVSGTRINGEVQSFDPSRDMAALEAQAIAIGGVKFLMVDPVVSAVAGDSHKNTEVRRALQPLVDLASRLDAVAVGISHFSKGGQGGDPASRVVGSIAFTAVARVVLVAAKVKGEAGQDDRRILARAKSNIGPDEGGFEYHIEQAEPLPGIHASYIAWGAALSGNARELLAEPEDGDADGKSAVDAATEFLTQALADGQTPTKTLQNEARDAGVSWASVRRASDTLGVRKKKAEGGAWYWRLPNLLNHVAQDVQRLNGEQVEQVAEQVEVLGGFPDVGATTATDDVEEF